MLFAVIERPPVVLGKAVSYDEAAAMKVPGVVKVVKIAPTPMPAKFAPLGGVAVIANSTWAAIKGREALNVKWDDGPNKDYDSDAFKAKMAEQAHKPGKIERNEGDVDKALAGADKVIERDYYIPHFVHAPMEPPAATVQDQRRQGRSLGVRAKPGRNARRRRQAARPEGRRCHRATSRCWAAASAANPSATSPWKRRCCPRRWAAQPVKVVWTREDDIQHSFYHACRTRTSPPASKDGKVVAWRHRSVAPSLMSNFMPDPNRESPARAGPGLDRHAVQRAEPAPGNRGSHSAYPHRLVPFGEQHSARIRHAVHGGGAGRRAREGSEGLPARDDRAGAHRRSAQDGDQPLWNYGDPWDTYPIDTARTRRVVEIAAKEAGWGRKLPKGHGMGIAVQRSFLTYVATVVEVAVDD